MGSEDARKKSQVRNSFYRALKALPTVIEENALSDILIYENGTLTIDYLVFRFYLDHLDFSRVRSQVNIRRIGYEYDVAVSFAGPDRPVVAELWRRCRRVDWRSSTTLTSRLPCGERTCAKAGQGLQPGCAVHGGVPLGAVPGAGLVLVPVRDRQAGCVQADGGLPVTSHRGECPTRDSGLA